MRIIFATWLATVANFAIVATAQSELPVPSRAQTEWLDAGVGVFVHWAPNVYQGTEGDNLSTPRDQINPDRFDANKIVLAAKSANAGYLIFVAKHVGGYCAWQTATTDYSLKTSPWRAGKGDMVGDLASACREQGLRFGVYLSPRSDIHQVGGGGHAATPELQPGYDKIYRRQLTEILTGYGPMFEMWFDGGNIVPVNDLIDKLAPAIITFQGRRPNSTRWVGTEHGFAPYPCWNTIDWKPGDSPQEGAGSPTGNIWCPAECDVSILRPAWFWREGSDSRILSLNDLVEIYYMSVGRGVNLLLNITPDGHGEIPAAQIRRLKEFGDEISARFAKPLASTKGNGMTLDLKLSDAQTVDHLQLREDIRKGERVREFVVEGCGVDGNWRTLLRGTQIGARQLVPLPATKLTGLRLKVEKSIGQPVIRDFSVFDVNRPVPKSAYRNN
jgi:alpha-L-fucosidase